MMGIQPTEEETMNTTTHSPRTQTALTWAALIVVIVLLGLAGGQDRAGEEAAAHARADAMHSVAP
jgi:hypothetical protein